MNLTLKISNYQRSQREKTRALQLDVRAVFRDRLKYNLLGLIFDEVILKLRRLAEFPDQRKCVLEQLKLPQLKRLLIYLVQILEPLTIEEALIERSLPGQFYQQLDRPVRNIRALLQIFLRNFQAFRHDRVPQQNLNHLKLTKSNPPFNFSTAN